MNSKLVVGIGLLVVELLAIELLGYWVIGLLGSYVAVSLITINN
jgi:hypothetical protein